VRLALVVLSVWTACWTGTVPDPAPPDQPEPKLRRDIDLSIKLRRTECFGMCPVFDVSVDHDGTVHYVGRANVAVRGERTRRVTRAQMQELSQLVEREHFFELDRYGHMPSPDGCATTGHTTTCTFQSFTVCSDTSHTVLTVSHPRRGGEHTIDDAHCSDDGAAYQLEDRVEGLVAPWIGR
jgi:hypothetical protein